MYVQGRLESHELFCNAKVLNTPYSKMAAILANFSILLFTCRLAFVASLREKYSFEFRLQERYNKG